MSGLHAPSNDTRVGLFGRKGIVRPLGETQDALVTHVSRDAAGKRRCGVFAGNENQRGLRGVHETGCDCKRAGR